VLTETETRLQEIEIKHSEMESETANLCQSLERDLQQLRNHNLTLESKLKKLEDERKREKRGR
jgi:hypothetical protein